MKTNKFPTKHKIRRYDFPGYLNQKPDNVIMYGTNDGRYSNKNTVYEKIKKKIKRLIKNPNPDCKTILRLDNKKTANIQKNCISILKQE